MTGDTVHGINKHKQKMRLREREWGGKRGGGCTTLHHHHPLLLLLLLLFSIDFSTTPIHMQIFYIS